MLNEECAEELRQRVRSRAAEKKITPFEAVQALLAETFDNDEQEVLEMWRFELHPRVKSKNLAKRLSYSFAVTRPVLGMFVAVGIAGYGVGVIHLVRESYYVLGALLGLPLLAFWGCLAPDVLKAMYRSFLPFREDVKRTVDDLRPQFVENRRIMGDDPVEAEIHASEQLEMFRSRMLEGLPERKGWFRRKK